MNTNLSILIPARNEKYLEQTVDDIFKHAQGDIEVIVGFDGWTPSRLAYWPVLNSHLIRHVEENPIGQRAMTNKLAELATGEFLMKIDAHCSFSQGFDKAMLEDVEDASENDLLAIDLRDLDVENWRIKPEPLTSQVVFDTDFELKSAPEKPGLIVETQCIHGLVFVVSRKKFFELNLVDESFGSWGLMGLEVPLKIWLSGGKVKVTKKAYMGHWYKQGEAVPYNRNRTEVENTFRKVKDWVRTQDIGWLIKKFNYPCDWTPQKVEELVLKKEI